MAASAPTGHRFSPDPCDYSGVWYGCGTANTIGGRPFVYAGGKATYSAWHRSMAWHAREVEKTFFVFGAKGNRPAVGYYDHADKCFACPGILGENPDGNAHRNPALLIDEEGYIHVFYGYHGGAQPIHVLRSTAPYDVSEWVVMQQMTDGGGSYPQPAQLLPGEILVPHRTPGGWGFRVTGDGGRTWEKPVELAAFQCDGYPSVYGITAADMGGYPRTMHFFWSRLGGGTEEERRTKHLWARRYNVYYACSKDGGRTWQRSDDTPYVLPIREEAAEKLHDSGERGIWLKDVQITPDLKPIALFVEAEVETYRSVWKVVRRDGGKWRFSEVTATDHMYDGGALALVSPDDFRVYGPTAPVVPLTDGGEIEEWRSTDQGRTWRRTKALTAGSTRAHNHVKTAQNHDESDGAFRVFWADGDPATPPEDKSVYLYCHGDTLGTRRISM